MLDPPGHDNDKASQGDSHLGSDDHRLQEEIDFDQFIACLPRWVLRSNSHFSRFLARTFHVQKSGSCPSSAVFPLPVPEHGVFDSQRSPKLNGLKWKKLAMKRALHVVVMALNFLYNNLRPPCVGLLGRRPNLVQRKIFSHLRTLIAACRQPGCFPLPPGRSGFEFIARLVELERFASSHPEFVPDPYSRAEADEFQVSTTKVGEIGAEEKFRTSKTFTPIRPYRKLDAGRLKLSGAANWDLADHLDSVLWLPFQEPLILQHGHDVSWDGPALSHESPEENLKLLKVWDMRGLLALFDSSHPSGHACRVFNNHKNTDCDRQIGDRRWFNGAERHPTGPSAFLPAGSFMTSLHCTRDCTLVGCSSDRRDFYHQAKVSRERAFTNLMPFGFPPEEFSGSSALKALEEVRAAPVTRESHGDQYGMQQKRSKGKDTIKEVYGGFSSLFQGDHLGVEYALDSHCHALQTCGLLADGETVLRGVPFPPGPLWQGLVIDDYFSISRESLGSYHKPRALLCLETAEICYKKEGILGSDEKTIRGADLFTVIGAEVDARKTTRDSGAIFVGAPAKKRLALAALSLKIAALPVTTKGLIARLAGNWVSVLMFRRSLGTILSKIFALGSRTTSDSSDVVLLPRRVADEIILASVLGIIAATDVSVPYSDHLYATDASMQKGAFTKKELSPSLTKTLWLGGDKKGSYTMLDSAPRACLRMLGVDLHDEAPAFPFEKIRKAPDLTFDAIEICGGSGVLSNALKDLGLVVSIPLDLSYSPHFNLCNIHLVNWIFHMISSKRVKAVILEPPCTTFSPAQHPASRSYDQPLGYNRLDKKTWLGNCLAFRCLAILWYAWRHEIIGLLEQPRLSKMSRLSPWKFLLSLGLKEAIIASCQFSSIHRKEFKFIGTGLEMSELDVRCRGGHRHVRIEGKYTKPSAMYTPQLANFLAGHIRDAIIKLDERWGELGTEPGLESVIINDCLCSEGWEVGRSWEWERPAHINVFESRSYVELLKDLLQAGGHTRFTCLLDSRVAKGAHAKGRSSSTSLRPSLNRACALTIAGNLHPSFGFAPTRLNTADCPTRDKELPKASQHSIVELLDESCSAMLHATQLSRASASWVRLFILASCCLGSEAGEEGSFGFDSVSTCSSPLDYHYLIPWIFIVVCFVTLVIGFFCQSPWTSPRHATPRFACWIFLLSGISNFSVFCKSPGVTVAFLGSVGLPRCCHGMPLNPVSAEERNRAARRSGVQLQADRVVLQQTRNRREGLLTAFDTWLAENMRTTVNELLGPRNPDADVVSDALVAYGKQMYDAGKSYGRFSETINAVTARRPSLRKQLFSAWDLAFNWVVDEPHEHNAALPLSVLLALASLALLWGWSREAAIILLGWSGILRIGEILNAKRQDLVLPCDAAPGVWYALLKIHQPKTRGRAARHQSARIDSSDVVQLLAAVYGKLPPSAKLWHLSPSTLRKRFSALQVALGLDKTEGRVGLPYSLASLRPGGATHWLQATEDAEFVRRKGRWISSRVLEIYLQESEFVTYRKKLSTDSRDRIDRLCRSFPGILEKSLFFLKCSIPENAWPKLW